MAENTTALALLKANLGFFNGKIDEAVEAYLESRLQVAAFELQTHCKIALDPESIQDADLQAMYAAWLYRKRATGEAKPPSLQAAIRNRQVYAPLEEEAAG